MLDNPLLQTAEEQAEEEQKGQIYCTACRKHFSNQSTLDNHLKSRKHIEEAERASKAAAAKPTDEEIQHKRVIEENAKNRLLSSGSSSSKATTSRTAPEAVQGDLLLTVRLLQNVFVCLDGVSESSVRVCTGGEVEEVEEEEVDEWVDEPLGVEQCLFCTHSSESLEANVAHMTSSHSFFIPDIEYLVDLDGLISYLGAFAWLVHLFLNVMPDDTIFVSASNFMFTSVCGVQVQR
jgi:pre-60S factor REI1